jgi:beta,beta-carotene 9',10'-dioxygenase
MRFLSIFLLLTATFTHGLLLSSFGRMRTLRMSIDSVSRLYENNLIEVSQRELTFTNPIPNWIQGTLLRNGPACFGTIDGAEVDRKYTHLFDGLSKLTSFNFDSLGKKVTFSTQFLKSNLYKKIIIEKGDIPPIPTTGPIEPPFTKLQNILGLFDSGFENPVVNVNQMGGKGGPWVAVTDAPVLMEFDPVTLETKSKPTYINSITSIGGIEIFSTAHPKNDVNSNIENSYNYFLELRPFPVPFAPTSNIAHIVKTNRDYQRTVVGSVNVGEGLVPYVHDISITEKYAILCLWPMLVDPSLLINGIGMLPQMIWDGDKTPTKIFVFDLKKTNGAPIAMYEAPGIFAYHHINAQENVDNEGCHTISVDVIGYRTPAIVNGENGFAYVERMRDPETRKLVEHEGEFIRFNLPLHTEAAVTPLKVGMESHLTLNTNKQQLFIELPVTNPRYRGIPYKYAYGVTRDGGDMHGAIVKHLIEVSRCNVATSNDEVSAAVWSSPNCFPSEAIFVPNPEATTEDDGVLLSQVYDSNRQESFLLLVDARSMTEVSRAYLGIICPYSFHGQFAYAN